jgi:LysM domain
MTTITRENPTDLVVRPVRPRQDVRRRPQVHRPHGAAVPSRGTGVLMSRASHRRRPITPMTTVVLALIAAAITVLLGLVAQLGGWVDSAEATTSVPSRLAVVQVQSGESLQQLAQRIAPDAPAGAIVDQIRELNELDSSAVDAGQTLIAPVG